MTIPVHNGMPFIRETLNSVLPQLGANDEVIVVDNASEDGTSEYLSTVHDSRVRCINRSETQSMAANWTQAIAETSGKYVKLMCADDMLLPGCIEQQVAALDSVAEASLVASQRMIVDEWDSVLIRRHGLNGLKKRGTCRDTIRRCLRAGTNLVGEPSALMFRSNQIKSAMPWGDKWPYVLDISTYARLDAESEFIFVHEPLACFRVSRNSGSAQLLGEQARDFRQWRDALLSSSEYRWTRIDSIASKINLFGRSLARRYYFRKVARKAKAMSEGA